MVGKGDTGLERTLRRRVRTQRACRRRTRRVTRRQPFRVSNRSLVGSTAETSSLPRRDRCWPRNCHDRCVGAPRPQYSPETSSSHGLLLLLLLAQRHPAVQGGSAHMFAQEERHIRQPYRICCLRQRRKRRQRTGASASAWTLLGITTNLRKMLKNLTSKGVVFMELPNDSMLPVAKAPPLRAICQKVSFVAVPCAHDTDAQRKTDTVQKDLRQNPWAKSKSATRPETNCRKPHLPSVCSKCPVGRAHRMSGDQSTLPAYVLYFNADPSSDEALRLHSAGVLSAACVPGNENEQPCHDAFLSLWPT